MKYYYYLIGLLFVFSCSKDDPIPNENPSEVDVSTLIEGNTVTLNWTAAIDPEGRELQYSVVLEGNLIAENLTELSYAVTDLEFNESYNGTIIVNDENGGTSETNFSFLTGYLIMTDGSIDDEYVESSTITGDGGVLVLGRITSSDFISSHYGATDIFIIKYDRFGALEWKKNYGGSNEDVPYRIHRLSDNTFIVVGLTISTDGDFDVNDGNLNAFAMKINDLGEVIWTQTYGGTNEDAFTGVVETDDNNLLFCGILRSNDVDASANNGASDWWLVKTDANGNLLWEKNMGGSDQDSAYGIINNGDGTYVIAGQSSSTDIDFTTNFGTTDGWVVNVDGDGNINYSNNIGGSGYDSIKDIAKSDQGDGYIIAGTTNSTDQDLSNSYGSYDAWLSKIDTSGNVVWSKAYGTSGSDATQFIISNGNGKYYTSFYHDDTNDGLATEAFGGIDGWYFAVNETGDVLEEESFGGSSTDYIQSVSIDAEGKIFLVGQTRSTDFDAITNNGGTDIFIVKK